MTPKRLLHLLCTLALLSLFTSACNAPNTAPAPRPNHPPATPLPQGTKADHVLVIKSTRTLHLYHKNTLLKTYPISLGFTPIGHKIQEGDGKTPEGHYTLDWRNPQSIAYRSLHISYPNRNDRATAQALGVSPGGDIMVHGIYNGWTGPYLTLIHKDWTNGCIAVSNDEMDELWRAIDDGTPIEIRP